MELSVKNLQGEEVSKIEVSDFVFNTQVNENAIARVVHWQRAKKRNQVQTIKNRSEVNMTGRKAYRQKGTGNARRAAKSTNIMRGGGVAHGISYIAHEYTLPKKTRRLGLRSVLSLKLNEGKVIILDSYDIETHKTKAFQEAMNKLNVKSALLVNTESTGNLAIASRNLYKFNFIQEVGVNVVDILSKDMLIMHVDAVKSINERLLQDARD